MARPDLWLRRVERRAAHIRKKRAKRIKAQQRHEIPKATLIETLFSILDTHNLGGPGQSELTQLALLTGFQRDSEQLYEEVGHLLDTVGSTHALRFSTKRIIQEHFRHRVSRVCREAAHDQG